MAIDDEARELLNTTLGDESDEFIRGYLSALGDCVLLQARETMINRESYRWLREYATERGIRSA
jgi:hypothetical protein